MGEIKTVNRLLVVDWPFENKLNTLWLLSKAILQSETDLLIRVIYFKNYG